MTEYRLTPDDAGKLEDLASRVTRAVNTARACKGDNRTEQRLLSQIRLYGEDLARSCEELAEQIRRREP